jgi:hypothetical protein
LARDNVETGLAIVLEELKTRISVNDGCDRGERATHGVESSAEDEDVGGVLHP